MDRWIMYISLNIRECEVVVHLSGFHAAFLATHQCNLHLCIVQNSALFMYSWCYSLNAAWPEQCGMFVAFN